MYDPATGRWSATDPTAQFTNPYLAMGNNPVVFVDPDGEFVWWIVGAYAALNVGINAIQGNINDFGDVAKYAAIGAINGALTQIPGFSLPIGNSGLAFSLAPQIALGTDGVGFGFNANLGYSFFNGFNAGVNFGGTYYTSALGTEASGFEGRIGYGLGYKSKGFQTGIGSTYFFSGETSQQSGQIFVGGGKWKLTYENDTWAPVPGLWSPGGPESDKYRTAALRFDLTGGRLKGANAGFNIFTGASNGEVRNGNFVEPYDSYRLGALYVGYGNARIGYNSERNIRGPIQNGFHNIMKYPHFNVLNHSDKIYRGFYSSNPYTLW